MIDIVRISSNRYKEIIGIITDTLIDTAVNSLPIDLKFICESFNLGLIKYSDLENSGIDSYGLKLDNIDGFVAELTDRNGNGCLYIFYDDSYPIGRQRFTIAHELGHYLLSHSKNGYCSISCELNNKRELIMEQEANYFARMILAPFAILDPIINSFEYDYNTTFETKHLVSLFDVSYQVAENIKSHYSNWKNSLCYDKSLNNIKFNKLSSQFSFAINNAYPSCFDYSFQQEPIFSDFIFQYNEALPF